MATLKELLGDAYKEGMNFAEVETAINGKNLVDLSSGSYVSKTKYDTAIGERDDFKARYTATLSDAQKAEQAAREREEHYKALEKEVSIGRYSKKLAITIKDDKIRDEIATLMAEGKYDEAIDKQNDYLANEATALEQRIKADLMKQNPQAQAGNDGAGTITKEQFAQMTVAERTKLYKEQPEKYNEFVNQN